MPHLRAKLVLVGSYMMLVFTGNLLGVGCGVIRMKKICCTPQMYLF